MDAYAPEIERKMKRLFDSLSENDRRRYAAVEATNWGMVGSSTLRNCCSATPRPSAED